MKFNFVLAVVIPLISLVLVAGCVGQNQPEGTIQPDGPSQLVPAPGVDPDSVDEMIVVDEPDAEPEPEEEVAGEPEPLPAPEPSPEETVEEERVESSVKEFDITAKRWEFIPSTITVNQGDTVLLHVKSIDVTHGISLPAFGINKNLRSEETVDIEFVADKVGSFSFSCSVYCGSGHGSMRGTLVVEK